MIVFERVVDDIVFSWPLLGVFLLALLYRSQSVDYPITLLESVESYSFFLPARGCNGHLLVCVPSPAFLVGWFLPLACSLAGQFLDNCVLGDRK